MSDHDWDVEAAAASLLTLAEYNIPVDVQELLVLGDPMRGVRPGALSASFKAALTVYRKSPTTPASERST